jgi:hypothetical protein
VSKETYYSVKRDLVLAGEHEDFFRFAELLGDEV